MKNDYDGKVFRNRHTGEIVHVRNMFHGRVYYTPEDPKSKALFMMTVPDFKVRFLPYERNDLAEQQK